MYILIEVPDAAADNASLLMTWLKEREYLSEGEVVTIASPQGEVGFLFRLLGAVVV